MRKVQSLCRRSCRCVYAAGAAAPLLPGPYAVLLAITTQAIRAILLASATATTLNGFEAPAAFVKKTGKPAPKISYAASNTLAKQTEASAPADVFVSADLD